MKLPARFTRTINCRFDDLDTVVDNLLDVFNNEARIVDIRHCGARPGGEDLGTQVFVLLWEGLREKTETKGSGPESGGEEDEPESKKGRIPHGVKSPLVEGFFREGKTRRSVMVMAGVFAVEEGAAFHPDDEIPAPPVLMAPGVDLSRYHNLVFNVPSRAALEGIGYREEIKRLAEQERLEQRLGGK